MGISLEPGIIIVFEGKRNVKMKGYPVPISMLEYCYRLNCVHTHTPDPDFPGGSHGKQSACNAGDPGSIPGLGRSPGEGNGNPLQYSCLENSMDREAWWAIVHGAAKNWTRLSDFHFYSPNPKFVC